MAGTCGASQKETEEITAQKNRLFPCAFLYQLCVPKARTSLSTRARGIYADNGNFAFVQTNRKPKKTKSTLD